MLNKVSRILTRIQKEIPMCNSRIQAVALLMDFALACVRYHVTFEEYRQYQFFNLKHNARKDYVTEYDVLKIIPHKFNDAEATDVLDDKLKFNQFFHECIGRDYCYIDGNNMTEFEDFISKHHNFMIKPTDAWCGHGVQKYACDESESLPALYERLHKQFGNCLVEEVIVQHEHMASLNTDSVNTIRVISMLDKSGKVHIPCVAVRIGRAGACIDNFCSGGMAAAVDPQTGIVISGAFDRNGDNYLIHPDTGTRIIGFQIPQWNEIVKFVQIAAMKLPNVRFIGWDVTVKVDGTICFVEGNGRPGARTIQLPTKQGIKQTYRRILGDF